MALAADILVILLLAGGVFCSLTAAVGVLRLPDFYTRTHAASVNDTAGLLLFAAAMIIESFRFDAGYMVWGRVVAIVLFMYFSGPVAAHAITKAAYLDGIRPWTRKDKKP